MENKYVIGVDLGGTKIAAVLVDAACSIKARYKVNTDAAEGVQMVLVRIKQAIYQVADLSGISWDCIAGIGISSPGPLSVASGTVIYAATLAWHEIPVRQIMQDEFKVPVWLENDCNAAAFAEKLLGAGIGHGDLIYITVSTGIGCGIIIDQKIHHGKHDAAGEFGHICVELDGRACSCGNKGCLQAYASGTAIARDARENMRGATNDMDCRAVEMAARGGDDIARSIWNQAGSRLGQGISILLQLFDPDIVVIGGGVSNAWDLFYDPMVKVIREQSYRLISEDMTIVRARLGDDAGTLGASLIILKELGILTNTMEIQ